MSRPASRSAARRGGRRARTSIIIPPALQPSGRIADTGHGLTSSVAETTMHAALGTTNAVVDGAPLPLEGHTAQNTDRGTPLSEATSKTVNTVPATVPHPPRALRPQREVRTASPGTTTAPEGPREPHSSANRENHPPQELARADQQAASEASNSTELWDVFRSPTAPLQEEAALPLQIAADILTPVVPAYVFLDDFGDPADTSDTSKRAREGTEQEDAARSTRRRALQDVETLHSVAIEDAGVNPWLSSAFAGPATADNADADESIIPATPTPPGRRPPVLIPDTPISMRRPRSAEPGTLLPLTNAAAEPEPTNPVGLTLLQAGDDARGRDLQVTALPMAPKQAMDGGRTEEAMDVDIPPHTPHGKGKGREGQDPDCACATCLRRLAESLARGDAIRLDNEDAHTSQSRPPGARPGPSTQNPIEHLNSAFRAPATTPQLHWNVPTGIASSSTQHTGTLNHHAIPRDISRTLATAPATNQLTRPSTPFFASTPRPGASLARVGPPITAADLLPLGNRWGDGDILPTALARGAVAQDHPLQPQTQEWPTVHRDDPEAMLRGLAIPWVETIWNDPVGTIALIEVFNMRFSTSTRQNRTTADALRGVITSATEQTSFHLVPPELAQGVSPASRAAPSLWAARGLSEHSASILTDQRVWTARSISFFAYPRTLSIPSWLLSLEGFITDNQDEIERTVSSVMRSARHYDQIVLMIRQSPEHALADPHEVARTVLSTLEVKVLTLGNGNIIANIYMTPPTRNIRRWRAWVQDLRSTRFGIYLTATATPRAISWCAGCRSADHPTHHCPFPMTQGWLGPDAGTGTYTTRPEQLGGGEGGNGIPLPAQPSTPARRGGQRGGGRGRGGRAF